MGEGRRGCVQNTVAWTTMQSLQLSEACFREGRRGEGAEDDRLLGDSTADSRGTPGSRGRVARGGSLAHATGHRGISVMRWTDGVSSLWRSQPARCPAGGETRRKTELRVWSPLFVPWRASRPSCNTRGRRRAAVGPSARALRTGGPHRRTVLRRLSTARTPSLIGQAWKTAPRDGAPAR